MKILILGAGIGGLTCAAFLKECGIECEIIEKAKSWDRQGYSLGMWDNGRDILKKLGLEDFFDREGERIKNYYLYTGEGKLIKKFNLEKFTVDYGSSYTHINRAKLHDQLLNKVGAEKISLNTTLTSLQQTDNKVKVILSNGQEKEYDLVIGADGIHSQVRKLVFDPTDAEHYKEWRAWFFWVDNKFKKKDSVIQTTAPGQFLSIFDDKDKTLCVAFSMAKHGEWDEESTRIERFKTTFKDSTWLIPQILENVKASDMLPSDIATISMKKWYKGRVVLLGDAAHALEPFAGLGATMSMEDAYVLAAQLSQVSESHTIEDTLAIYEKKRKLRFKNAVSATWGMSHTISRSWLWNTVIRIIGPYVPIGYFTKSFHKLLQEEI